MKYHRFNFLFSFINLSQFNLRTSVNLSPLTNEEVSFLFTLRNLSQAKSFCKKCKCCTIFKKLKM